MPEIPDCLARRYRALDELIKELTSDRSDGSNTDCCSNDPGVKLMCNFWNILKENPDCDLTQAVEERMGVSSKNGSVFQPKRVTCYMAGCCNKDDGKDKDPKKGKGSDTKSCAKSNSPSTCDNLPLTKVLCNLKEAASFERKCQGKVNDLLATQKELQDQIVHLEHREKEGIQMLKQADCMWSCMEQSYKKKVAESLERQKGLLKQLKEIEGSTEKWRKNKKDLEFQMDNIAKCHQEIKEKITEKTSDLKCIDLEIADFKKRIESNKKDLEATKRSFGSKKSASDGKMAFIANEVARVEKMLYEEQKRKSDKEEEGSQYIKEAREDLQKLCKVLLQKKLENEDMRAEKEALLLELEMLRQTCDQCKDKCKNKQQTIEDEIIAVDKEIGDFKVRCIRCHECTDTVDVRKLCTDCPRCLEERNCLLEGDHCSPDQTMDCVCMTVKQKFLDNVFDNMYTVLERQTKTCQGKAVANVVLDCLRKSRNGKLNAETRKILQDFILFTIKKNLNLTIVGGAVKTRCEMDPETYKQLMLCLKQIKVKKAPHVDKGTPTRKDPCRRWGSTSECNCPGGPKDCICTRKAPPPPDDPTPCPEDPDDKPEPGELVACPHKESTPCGPDCGMQGVPDRVATDVAAWRPSPCQAPTCQFNNMRAAQCVLGPEALSQSRGFKSVIPFAPSIPELDAEVNCRCGKSAPKVCDCHKDVRSGPRERIIEEVMGRYTEVSPIEKLFCTPIYFNVEIKLNSMNIFNLLVYELTDTKQLKSKNKIKCDKIVSTIHCVPFGDRKHSDKDVKETKHQCKHVKKKNISDVATETKRYESKLSTKNEQIKRENINTTNRKHSNLDIIFEKEENQNDKQTWISQESDNDSNLSVSKDSSSDGSKLVAHESKLQLHDIAPDISKSASGNNITMALDEDLIKYIVAKTNDDSNFFVTLRENAGSYYMDFTCSDDDDDAKKLKVKKTPSGNLLLEIEKKEQKKLVDKKNGEMKIVPAKNIRKIQTSKQVPGTFADSYKMCKTGIREQKQDVFAHTDGDQTKTSYIRADLKGLKNEIKESVILRKTSSDNYDIVLNKEFENWFKDIIKCQKDNEDNTCVKLLAQNPEQFIISFDRDESSEYEDAFLVRSESGNLKLIKEIKEVNSKYRNKGSLVSATTLEKILNKKIEFNQKRMDKNTKSKIIKGKCCSDSNIYNRFKIESSKTLGLENFPTKLVKTSSGNFTIVMDKDSRKSFATNLKRYLCGSSTGFIPIRKDENGEVTIVLNGELSKEVQYGSLKITPSGNIYVTLKENKTKNTADISTVLSSHFNLKWEQFIDEVQNPEVKGIATTCNAKEYSSCDVTKCVCKNIYFKSKNWFIDDPTAHTCTNKLNNESNIGSAWSRTGSDLSNSNGSEYNIPTNSKSYNPPHIVIRPRNKEIPLSNNRRDNISKFDGMCPDHANRYSNLSNELLEISSLCNCTERGTSNINNSNRKNTSTVSHSNKIKIKEDNYDWDSIEYLPHQLPPFLKDFM